MGHFTTLKFFFSSKIDSDGKYYLGEIKSAGKPIAPRIKQGNIQV